MKPDFALEDPLTFNAVLPWSHFSTAGGKGNRDAASSKLLQEKVQLWQELWLSISADGYCKGTPWLLLCGVSWDMTVGFAISSFTSVNHAGSILLKEKFFPCSVNLSNLERKGFFHNNWLFTTAGTYWNSYILRTSKVWSSFLREEEQFCEKGKLDCTGCTLCRTVIFQHLRKTADLRHCGFYAESSTKPYGGFVLGDSSFLLSALICFCISQSRTWKQSCFFHIQNRSLFLVVFIIFSSYVVIL